MGLARADPQSKSNHAGQWAGVENGVEQRPSADLTQEELAATVADAIENTIRTDEAHLFPNEERLHPSIPTKQKRALDAN